MRKSAPSSGRATTENDSTCQAYLDRVVHVVRSCDPQVERLRGRSNGNRCVATILCPCDCNQRRGILWHRQVRTRTAVRTQFQIDDIATTDISDPYRS